MGEVFGCLLGSLLGGFELTVDEYVGILVETGIGLEARFGFGAAFEDTEIVLEEADTPFEGSIGAVVLEGVGLALRLFDEFAVRHAGGRPGLGEMIGVELEESRAAMMTADDDVFLVMTAFFHGIHGAPEGIVALNRHKITHTLGIDGRVGRELHKSCDIFAQTVNYARF